ncbi:defective in Cullin neddylation protein 1 [Lentinula aciculospora]|uniref:Defective in cullin neddylation protein n=1 Tax=Lentinula aciculospora TaxID=153920 RepID=A0A9W9AFN4_9AGAR|nr:defective in Cullin neddylation protein 1 [Lentinula aciculospora]
MTFRQQQLKDYPGPSSIPFSLSTLALAILALLAIATLISQKHKLRGMSSKSKVSDGEIASFCAVTGVSSKDARKFLEKHKRLDAAVDAYYSNPNAFATLSKSQTSAPSTSKLDALFEGYKDPDSEDISINGTIKLCEDLEKDPEDVVLLAVAYELKSPEIGRWTRKGWIEGWKANGCDSLSAMKNAVARFGDQLSSDSAYFRKVYLYTFDLGRSDGARSLGMESAQAFWSLLIPYGLKGGALSHISSTDDDDDMDMNGAEGWRPEYTEWWFEFLNEKGGKGVSKDTWSMFLDFMRSIDAKFEKYDMEAAWPSTIDYFVDFAKERLASLRT